MKKNKKYIISITIFCLIHLLFIFLSCTGKQVIEENSFITLFYVLGGFILIMFFNFIIKKILNSSIKYKNFLFVIFNIFAILLMILFECIFIMHDAFYYNLTDVTPKQWRYPATIKLMTNEKYRISHFPKKIPSDAQNYYFKIERDFHGYNIHYLKFILNKEYIDFVISSNKDNIYKEINYSDINDYYRFLEHSFDIKEKSSCKVYIMKNQNNDTSYTSGIIGCENGQIVYFYANFNLKQYDT
ncbi:hypothetical protein II906_08685 [bacterium]|nr:hypothetical protein [bacterium]